MTTKIRVVNNSLFLKLYLLENCSEWSHFVYWGSRSEQYQDIVKWSGYDMKPITYKELPYFNKRMFPGTRFYYLPSETCDSDTLVSDDYFLYSKNRDAFIDIKHIHIYDDPATFMKSYTDIKTPILIVSDWIPINMIDQLIKDKIISEEIEVPTDLLDLNEELLNE